ncbi:MAG: alkaline phosphatase [Oceanicaulis sp.]
MTLITALLAATALTGAVQAQEAGAPRNVILMISDGAGFNGWLAADYYEGEAGSRPYQVRPEGAGEYYLGASAHYALRLIDERGAILPNDALEAAAGVEAQGYVPRERWERFDGAFANDFGEVSIPYTSYTDSAAAGTAIHSGRKTVSGRVNMNWDAAAPFRTIAHIADRHGLATGVVTTVQASHATPASAWAQAASRNDYAEIFQQMADGRLDVIMGTGHPLFDGSGRPVENPDGRAFRYVGGQETWSALTSEAGLNGYTFIDTRAAFEALASGDMAAPERLVGIARSSGSTQATREDFPEDASAPSGMAFNPGTPDLATMSLGALSILDRDPDGFFVMIEGGAVDWMGHANNMPRFIEEQIDFNAAVGAVIDWVETHSSWEETLLIVTSDHETGGIWGEGSYETPEGETRYDPARDRFVEFRAVQDRGAGEIPGHQFASGNHTNELVPLWAIGRGASRLEAFERFDLQAQALWGEVYGWDGGYVDNTAIFHVMDAVIAGEADTGSN